MNEEGDFSLKTLSSVINDYLRGIRDRTEKSLLNQFKDFIQNKHSGIKVKDVRHEHFDAFLKTFQVSEASLESYKYRLNRFKAHIGLSQEKKVKENRKSDLEYGLLEKKHAKEIAEKNQVIDMLNAELAEKDKLIDTLNSKGMDIETIQNLEAKKAQLNKEIAEREKVMENQRIFEIECPLSKGLVSLGNDCHTCDDYLNCPLSSRRPDLLYAKKEEKEKEETS